MKSQHLLLLLCLVLFTACPPDPGPDTPSGGSEYLNVANVDIPGGSTTATLSIQASQNCEWSINWDAPWIKSIAPSSGRGSNHVTITVEVNPSSTASRSTLLAIKSKNNSITREVTVTQSASNVALNASPTSLEFSSDAGSQSIHITSNSTWSIGGNNEWCHVSQTSGDGSADVTVTVDSNNNEIARGPISLIISSSSGLTAEVSVVQKGIPTLNVLESEKVITAVGTECLISVVGTAEWTAKSESSWAHISEEKSHGTGNGQVMVRCDENLVQTDRTAKIVFHWSRESTMPVSVSIRQKAATLPLISGMNVTTTGNNEVSVSAHYESASFPITEYGVCYDFSSNPTVENSKISHEGSSQSGTISIVMDNLVSKKTYYVRAYAKNKVGVTYSEEYSFELQEKRPGTDDNILPNYARKR